MIKLTILQIYHVKNNVTVVRKVRKGLITAKLGAQVACRVNFFDSQWPMTQIFMDNLVKPVCSNLCRKQPWHCRS